LGQRVLISGTWYQQLFGWRRQARQSASSDVEKELPAVFVPAVVDAAVPAPTSRSRGTGRVRRTDGNIEVTIDGVTVRVGRGAEAKTIAAVIRALKAGP
jgi:transposase